MGERVEQAFQTSYLDTVMRTASIFKRALHLCRPLAAGVSVCQPHILEPWLGCWGTKGAAEPLRALPWTKQGPTHGEGSRQGSHSDCSCILFKGTSVQRFLLASITPAPVCSRGLQSLAARSWWSCDSAVLSAAGQNAGTSRHHGEIRMEPVCFQY